MKYLITTYCDENKGDFLINHWLRSLRENVDLTNIDLLVIDFGLTESHKKYLTDNKVFISTQTKSGRMSNYHYRFLADFLDNNNHYISVLYCDCGDVIFQKDISHLFEIEPDKFKAVYEPNFNFKLHKKTLGLTDVKSDYLKIIEKTLDNKSTVNGGFVIGPARLMKNIWSEYNVICKGVNIHGTDQLVINYLLHKKGFYPLERKYNYVTFLNEEHFWIDKNLNFVNKTGIIPVVHNAGKYDYARSIRNFGYKNGIVRGKIHRFLFIVLYKLINRL